MVAQLMWRVLPYAFAILVAFVTIAIVKTSVGQFVDQLRGNISTRSDDVETAARAGDGTGGGIFVRAHKKVSSRLLSSGSESRG